MTPLLHMLANPDVAYVLFVVGLFGLLIEICHPGGLAPGIAGLCCLVLAGIAFTVLPVSLLGLFLLVAAVSLFALDATLAGHGGLALLGMVGFVIGSLTLYGGWPGNGGVAVSWSLVLALSLAAGGGAAFLIRTAIAMHRLPPIGGAQRLLGATGVVVSALGPVGTVRVGGELWTARLCSSEARGVVLASGLDPVGTDVDEGVIAPPGTLVRVVGRRGLTLEVDLLERTRHAA